MEKFIVLVVDDEEVIVELIQEILELLNVDYYAFRTAAEAFRFLEKRKVGLIISDVNLPDMNGLHFYQEVVHKFPELAENFLFISGLPLQGKLKAIVETTRSGFIQKPFNISDFRSTVQKFLPQ